MENMMQAFPEKTWDVTNTVQFMVSILICAFQKSELTLEREEAVIRHSTTCRSSSQRRPYAQLNVVEQRSICFGICQAIHSDLAPIDEEGNGGMVPGCGCEQLMVADIIRELNLRKDGRGKIAQMRQQTYMLDSMSKIGIQLPMLLKHYNVKYPPDEATMRKVFGEKVPIFRKWEMAVEERQPEEFPPGSWDVTCFCERLSCAAKTLTLEQDEAVVEDQKFLTGSTITTRVPYANIDAVSVGKAYGCCTILEAGDLTKNGDVDDPMMPGCGCETGMVEELRAELQRRVDARGNRKQINQLEEMTKRFEDLVAQLPLLQEKLNVADLSYPPAQETMLEVYGSAGPEVLPPRQGLHEISSKQFGEKFYDVTNHMANCCCCGTMRHTVKLEPEELVEEKTCFGMNQNVERKPYAQLGQVDVSKICCCLYVVNNYQPGCGCDRDIVAELAQELQERKVGRGNIAQLRNQENTMIRAIESDIRTDVIMNKQGVFYPPSQETMASIYGAQVPTLPPVGARGQEAHLISSEEMELKGYDITMCVQRCSCGSQHMELNNEEAVFHYQSPCVDRIVREPYAQMGSVEVAEACGVCVQVSTDQALISPGCGCERDLVAEISGELQNRKVKRGNIAQIRQQENLMMEIIKLSVKLDLLLHKAQLSFPPTQAFMDQTFGAGSQRPSAVLAPAPRRESRVSVSVKVPPGAQPGDQVTVTAQRGSVQATVPEGAREGETIQVELPRSSNTVSQAETAALRENIS